MNAVELLNKLKAVNIERLAIDTLEDNTEQIADLNASQLAQGRRADNSEVLPSYRPLTISLKSGRPGLSGVTSFVTLYDKGNFYRGLYALVRGVKIEYGSSDPKADKLEEKYSKARGSIFGLTDDNRQDLIRERIAPQFYEKLNNVMR